ncbi:hypothetical protein [Rhodoferax saidenbachensis]|uniref:YcxB-like protein domain-containing protein n=1 Tax=Rhodoferax saidenbachensis TaxID=1484693 RepID=A0ABU1ZPF0_9BURK|nr:hypothetical protein [Rhodoferax saidenbachensis]MDR7307410.1 hypothetical protein [Rhodoferax saidenbachensis]
MKFKLRDSFIQREVQIRKWQMLFLILAALTVVVVLFQQHVRSKHQAAALVVLFAVGALWKISIALKTWPSIAEQISLELGENELILGHPHGENRINYSAIEKVELNQKEWPELSLIFKDRQSIKLQGFDNVVEIAKSLKERVN